MRWTQVPRAIRARIESIASDNVVAAENQSGGFSPGLASRLFLANGSTVFAKAIGDDWPVHAGFHRSEIAVTTQLPPAVPAPRLRGHFDDDGWVGLVFDDVAGWQPPLPWRRAELGRVLDALAALATVEPPPIGHDHPRLGGWSEIAADRVLVGDLPRLSTWAADHLESLTELEPDGVQTAQGNRLVHFDLFPHNILLTPSRVCLVDWPHARLGNPVVDLVSILCPIAMAGGDPSPIAQLHPTAADLDARSLDAVIAALAGFCAVGALTPARAGQQPVATAKHELANSLLTWLARRRATQTAD
jgi:aminoglycoside phosphotransferase (APT) family kinase protein